jgi:hypothetical protein
VARLIEIRGEDAVPSALTLGADDLLVIGAAGGRVRGDSGVVELLGAFVPGVVAGGGQVISPMGAPSIVVIRARRPGRTAVDLVMGDPWHSARPHTLEVTVEE